MSTLQTLCPECHTINSVNLDELETSRICKSCENEVDDPFPIDVPDEIALKYIENDDLPLIIDFYSKFCGPCMAMYDDYEDAALVFGLKARFLKINADEQLKIAEKYGVGALPTLIAFHKGEEVNRVIRQLSRVELTLWAEELVKLS